MIIPPSNPFATHHVKSGALSYRFPESEGIDAVLQRLRRHQYWGQIIGPHGTGKTTLLRSLCSQWQSLNRRPLLISLQNRQARLPALDWSGLPINTQIIVDGYEQLHGLHKLKLHAQAYRFGFGLLVTSHQVVRGLPVIHRTHASPELLRQLVDELGGNLDRHQIDRCYERSNHNIREALMLLYDEWRTHHDHSGIGGND